MERIKLQNEITKTIEINDSGDAIYLQVGDMVWIDAYKSFIERLAECAKQGSEVDAESDAAFSQMLKVAKTAAACVDEFFGPGTCKKFSGVDVPAPDFIADFVDQVSEFVSKFTGERIKKVNDRYTNRAQRRAARR